eukprot:GILK01016710.1.p1 GENE.GILK01016710.1~~GILK01016710.1.p1  ORF type:complete len:164 (+),score=31.67 GILK01016710.1:162-653(+)
MKYSLALLCCALVSSQVFAIEPTFLGSGSGNKLTATPVLASAPVQQFATAAAPVKQAQAIVIPAATPPPIFFPVPSLNNPFANVMTNAQNALATAALNTILQQNLDLTALTMQQSLFPNPIVVPKIIQTAPQPQVVLVPQQQQQIQFAAQPVVAAAAPPPKKL